MAGRNLDYMNTIGQKIQLRRGKMKILQWVSDRSQNRHHQLQGLNQEVKHLLQRRDTEGKNSM